MLTQDSVVSPVDDQRRALTKWISLPSFNVLQLPERFSKNNSSSVAFHLFPGAWSFGMDCQWKLWKWLKSAPYRNGVDANVLPYHGMKERIGLSVRSGSTFIQKTSWGKGDDQNQAVRISNISKIKCLQRFDFPSDVAMSLFRSN